MPISGRHWMGNYINIGLLCDKKDFKEKVVKLMQSWKIDGLTGRV